MHALIYGCFDPAGVLGKSPSDGKEVEVIIKEFKFVPPGSLPNSITVVSPNGEENWLRGTNHLINWTYTGNPGTYVKIELLKNGMMNSVIAPSASNNGSQSWIIPLTQTPGSDYKIRVTSTTDSSYNDTSNINFTISSLTPKTGDINGDGELTLVDVIYLAKHVGGFIGYEKI